jgi:hypothetical protein
LVLSGEVGSEKAGVEMEFDPPYSDDGAWDNSAVAVLVMEVIEAVKKAKG